MTSRILSIIALGILASPLHAETPPPPALPQPVASFGATALNGRFYVYGGHAGRPHAYNREDVNGNLYAWAPGEGEWSQVAQGEPAQGASLVTDGTVLLRIGGMAARNEKEGERQDLWSTATATQYAFKGGQLGKGEPLPDMPSRRSSHDSIIEDGIVYVFGGWDLSGGNLRAGGDWHETFVTLDLDQPEEGWKSHPQPFAKRAISVAAAEGKIYVLGGMNEEGETSRSTHVYEIASGKWSEGPALPEHKLGGFGFACVTIGDQVYASGAEGSLLHLDGDVWEPVLKLAQPRFFHRLLPGKERSLLVMGGVTPGHQKASPEWVHLPHPATAGWPKFQGPRGNGTTPETGWLERWSALGEPKVAWRAELGLGLAAFAAADGRVYGAGNDGKDQDTVWCLDLESGEVVWKHAMEVPTKCHKMPIVPYGPAATPAVVDGTVYHLSRFGHLLAFDAANGDIRWKTHLVDALGGVMPVYGYANSPAIAGDRLYLDIGQDDEHANAGSTVCLNRKDGTVIWQQGEGQAGYATPQILSVNDRDLLVLFKGEALELRDPDKGDLLASHATTTRDFCNCATPHLLQDYLVISHTGEAGTRGFHWDGKALTQEWSTPGHGLLFHSGTPFEGKLVAFNDESRHDSILQLLDPQTGKALWESDALPKGNFVISDDGAALFLGRSGELVAAKLRADGIEVHHRMQVLGGKTYIQPTVVDGRILCRNNDGQTVCLDLR